MDRPPKVRNFHVASATQQQIFRLDVAMNDVLRMAVDQSVHELTDNFCRKLGSEGALLSQQLVDRTPSSVLQHQVDALLVVEVTVKAQNIFVPSRKENIPGN